MPPPNAVELTVDQAWFVADAIGAGTFPWVLAITPPYAENAHRAGVEATQVDSLTRSNVMYPDGEIEANVAEWIRVVCYCDQWLDLRFAGPTPSQLMRGIVARRGTQTVVALRNNHLVTFTSMTVDHPEALVPILVSGLAQRHPGAFDEFALPAQVGARADERLREGASPAEMMDFLGVPSSARPVIETALTGPRSYVEIVAGQRRDGVHTTSEVGVSIIDTSAERILVSPWRAHDGEWISTFAPGKSWAIAVAVEQLTATLPNGRWFPGVRLTRDFAEAI